MSAHSAPSLTGQTLVITRPAHQAIKLTQRLQQAGATVIACPLLAIEALPCELLLHEANLHAYQLALFTSPNAVEYFFKQLTHPYLPSHFKIAAIGNATSQTLANYGIQVDYAPDTHFTSEELLALPAFAALSPQKILLVKGSGGRTLLADTLRARNMQVISCEVYQRITQPLPTLNIQWEAVSWVMITSLEALQHLVTCWGGAVNPAHVPLLVGSERIAQAAQQLNFKRIHTAHNPSDTAMWEALHRVWNNHNDR
ncbi:uroporphyrinogen-III synthase [Thiofilum flexile]|uniref:uroporphyrinogen-III synthase n=1 Tax=Thiofilum flexile TaxID=125627 RepID=UPI0003654D35|nr:uroporphyrinogen-III synthase [Thiofilum flexile]